jgi:hypothetical protein
MIDEQLNKYLELSRYAGKPRGTVLYSGQSTAAIHLVAARFRVGRTLWCVYRNLVVSCGVPLVSLVTIVTCAGWACASVSSVHDRTLKKPRRDVQAARPPDPRPDVSGDHAKTVLVPKTRAQLAVAPRARGSAVFAWVLACSVAVFVSLETVKSIHKQQTTRRNQKCRK